MKKLSRMLALSLALAMVLGMTAFAKESPSTETGALVESKTPGVTATEVFPDLNENWETDLSDVLPGDEYNKFWDKINEGAPSGAAKDTKPQLYAVVELKGEVPSNGKVNLQAPGISATDAEGWVFYAYHYNNGVCEVLPITILGDGLIQISGVTAFSNFIIVGYPKDVTTTGDNGSNNSGNNSTTITAGTSPKTGESASMAMLIVLVSLAGASVLGAKRAFSAR